MVSPPLSKVEFYFNSTCIKGRITTMKADVSSVSPLLWGKLTLFFTLPPTLPAPETRNLLYLHGNHSLILFNHWSKLMVILDCTDCQRLVSALIIYLSWMGLVRGWRSNHQVLRAGFLCCTLIQHLKHFHCTLEIGYPWSGTTINWNLNFMRCLFNSSQVIWWHNSEDRDEKF